MLSVLIVTWPEERPITTPVSARAYGFGASKKCNGISIFVATWFRNELPVGPTAWIKISVPVSIEERNKLSATNALRKNGGAANCDRKILF
jgi:hypothetical protein